MAFWQLVRSDLETKRQLVAVALVAALVTAFEIGVFYMVVVPQVRDAIQWMLVAPRRSMDPDAENALDVYLQLMDQQERRLVATNNAYTKLVAALILGLPLVLVAVMCSRSAALWRSPWRGILWDVLIVSGAIIAFQIHFFFFTRGWIYPSPNQIAVTVVEDYDRAARESGWPNTAVAADQVRSIAEQSPFMRRLTEKSGTWNPSAFLETALRDELQRSMRPR